MSYEFGVGRKKRAVSDFGIGDLIAALDGGVHSAGAQTGRRNRRRAAKKRLAQSSLLAPILAAEGCLTVGKEEVPLGSAESTGGSSAAASGSSGAAPGSGLTSPDAGTSQAAQDDFGFNTPATTEIQITTSELLANDFSAKGEALQLVRVYGASNGTVSLNGNMVTFTPNHGFEGAASFKYEVRDADGELSTATVEIQVGDAAPDGQNGEQGDSGSDGDAGDGGGSNGGGGGGGSSGAQPDAAMMADMAALMSLVPLEGATHVAVQNGSWFDPATWANGQIPDDGAKVVISDGVTVQYDGESPVSLFTVRVDGALEFATDVNTFMEVDTFVVSTTGRLTIGTADNPVAPGVEAVIQIADNGPIDVQWDTRLLSRGIISRGDVEIYGAEKDTFLKVATDPMAGDTSITLEEVPAGWQVGDKLVLTGTNLTSVPQVAPGELRDITTEDEELIITNITGNVITFATPLQFDHDTPRADLKAYVANYSRNIRFETENPDSVPVSQRGHVMFMGSDSVDVRYAEFYELGRTDKSQRAVTADDLDVIAPDSNLKARYPLHFHRVGVDSQEDMPLLVGNAVWGSPGWGVVQHDSNAILADNAVYDAFGAGFVAETGNEAGRWVHNISIKSIGVEGGAKWGPDVDAFDLGRTGAGFWFQGRLVAAVDNVAAGVPGGQGFVYMSRGAVGDVINVLPENVPQSETLRYLDDALINKPAISQFAGNEAIATDVGLEVIKASPIQDHDVRTVIEGFTAWEVRTGIHLQYTGHYTLKDIDLVATEQTSGGATPAQAIELGPNTIDIVVNGANLDGFDAGFLLRKEVINLNNPFDGDFQYVFIDVNFQNIGQNFINGDANDLILTGDQLVNGRLLFDSDLDGLFPQAPKFDNQPWLELSGTKTDSIGSIEVSQEWDPFKYGWFSLRGAVEQEGYWTLPDGRNITVFDQYVSDRATGELLKFGVLVENLDVNNLRADGGFTRIDPIYNGVLDVNSQAPVAQADLATVTENQSVIIDVLANDFDPDGDPLNVDGLVQPRNGRVYENDDNTLTYIPDPNYVGNDEFWYWVEDNNGNFTKAQVQVTVEI